MYPILSIDYGEKNFGLAISDTKGLLATPLQVISITKNRDIKSVILEILQVCKENNVKSILVGKPQLFSENQIRSQKKIEKFLDLLKKHTTIPIYTYDESFSTTEAKNMLTSSGQNSKSYKKKIDSIAATVFLQEFLNSKNNKNATQE